MADAERPAVFVDTPTGRRMIFLKDLFSRATVGLFPEFRLDLPTGRSLRGVFKKKRETARVHRTFCVFHKGIKDVNRTSERVEEELWS